MRQQRRQQRLDRLAAGISWIGSDFRGAAGRRLSCRGHESITTTIDLYGHVSEQSARDAVAAAAAGLGLQVPRAALIP